MLTRGYTHLSAEERETLSLAHGQSLRTMATVLGRAPSTLSREAARRTHLGQGCSPEQIAGRLQRAYPDDMQKHLSGETIYAALYVLPRGTLRSALLTALRQARKARRPRSRGTDRRGQIPHMTPIAERPAEVATRTVPGHWEGDLLKGARNGSAVGTLGNGRHAWSSWPGWRGRMRGVPARASRRNSGMCPLRCAKP